MRHALFIIMAATLVACTSEKGKKYELAQEKLKTVLKAPSTAVFEPLAEVDTLTFDGKFIMDFWVEAQNEVGVPLRKDCRARFDSKGRIYNIEMGGEEVYWGVERSFERLKESEERLQEVKARLNK